MTAATEIFGSVDSRFEPVREALRDNFAVRGELGAAVAVVIDGKPVVDIWGGIANHATQMPWARDTTCLIFSATKGVVALCAHMLVERGELDLEAPVALYWPEFAAAGKQDLSVRLLLNHQAGLPAILQPLPPEAIYDWALLTSELAQQAPSWEPGTAHGYHAMTLGWLIGELVHRISGKSIGQFVRDEIARPLGLDLWIGLPESEEPRVARLRMAPPTKERSLLLKAMFERGSLSGRAFLNPRGMMMPGQANDRAIHAAEIPAANGIATARSLARLYAVLAQGGRLDGIELLGAATIDRLRQVESEGIDRVLLCPTRFTSGFLKSIDNRPDSSFVLGPNPGAFGHPGAGGAFGMADPDARVAIAYIMNQLGHGIFLNPRGQAIVDAVYRCL